jgi:DNA invertase Pin-like site-specific DNA recombinase
MKRLRCAIYTRKSTEEGLDQEFNSLDAQRASCEAYILSQAGEGWVALQALYDDGGISGGTMNRPALQRLLGDVEAGKIDAVIVYKVDRLTRALTDFAKIVDVFDAKGVSFVSVTQQFNTTTSMGRLTLNVLLSFAQFEREVTAERIRDKIAASKKKGMWMGGLSPLGYDAVDKKLVINEAEAETVRTLFGLYLTHANMTLVKQEADRQGLKTKIRKPSNGQRRGGESFTRGHLYKLLSNPVYIGEVDHKSVRYAGEHNPIIDQETWDAVQEVLASNAVVRRCRSNAKAPSLLAGLLVDEDGNRMRPSHANKAGRRYRYYISTVLAEEYADAVDGWRLPARAIEEVVLKGISNFLRNGASLTEALNRAGSRLKVMLSRASSLADRILKAGPSGQREVLLELVTCIEVRQDRIRITLRTDRLCDMIGLGESLKKQDQEKDEFQIDLPVSFRRRGVEMKLVIADDRNPMLAPDLKLISVIARGHAWFGELKNGEASSLGELVESLGVDQGDVSRLIPLAFLAPDIINAILEGSQPVELTATRLMRMTNLPASWAEQRQYLGFS